MESVLRCQKKYNLNYIDTDFGALILGLYLSTVLVLQFIDGRS